MTITQRDILKSEIFTMLGGSSIGVELDDADLEMAIVLAFDTYRQRAENSVEEAFTHLEVHNDQAEYFLPKEVVEVRKLYRRGYGNTAGQGGEVDPFELAYTNMFLLGAANGAGGGQLTFELYHQHNELNRRMFGAEISFTWDTVQRKLTLHRDMSSNETILVEMSHNRPDESLLKDYAIRPWLRSWALAESKMILAQVRGKYQSLNGGPQGSTQLNYASLLAEAQMEKEKLIEDLKNRVDGSRPLGFLIG